MREKRNRKRQNSPHRVNVIRSDDGMILGRLVNITIDGMMYLGEAAQPVDTPLRLRIPLPTMAGGHTSIEVQGNVVWCRGDENPRYHRVGLKFSRLGAEEGYIIETVLQRLHLVG